MGDIVFQKIRKECTDEFSVAKMYFALLSDVNSFELTTREVELMAFTATRGTISYAVMREEFCSLCDTSLATINNIISKLKRKGVLVKDNGKIRVHPAFALNFKKDGVVLQISLMNGKTNEHVREGVSG